MRKIKLFSSDLNGTLVKQHTMSDMIKIYLDEKKYQQAKKFFELQTAGKATMEETFSHVAPLSKGLTLRQSIEYTRDHLLYSIGFSHFIDELRSREIPLVINSTGYSVTIYSIRAQIEEGTIHGHIGNNLKFESDNGAILTEDELEKLVFNYFLPSNYLDNVYDKIKSIDKIELGINNESAKTKLILDYAEKHFHSIKPNEIAHMGDTMGDSIGIYEIAKLGGLGIAFNPNDSLLHFINNLTQDIRKNIIFVKDDLSEVLSKI